MAESRVLMTGRAARIVMESLVTRRWALSIRFLSAALLVLVALFLQAGVWVGLRDYPFLLFFPTIVLCTVLFGSGPGFAAVGLS